MESGITNPATNMNVGLLTLPNSIVVDRNNPNAVDTTKPLPFMDWLPYFAGLQSDPRVLLKSYKQYVIDWQTVNSSTQSTNQDEIQSLYVSLLQNIAVNFLTREEKRFVDTADYTDPNQAAAVIPLFVRKIKDVCLYYASVREDVTTTPYRHNLKVSNFALQKAIAECIDNSFLDPEINKLLVEEGITPSNIKGKFSVGIEELYDLETNYYDINPSLSASVYEATGDRDTYFAANTYELDPDLFIDFDRAIVKQIKSYPVLISSLGAAFAIDFPNTADDLQFLKDPDFKNLVNTLDKGNLNLHTLYDALSTFSGTTFYYLSTNYNREFTYNKLFEADEFKNYLNRRFPTILQVDSDKLYPVSDIGGFFKPDKLGIQNFLAFDISGSIGELVADTIYVFPDPNLYGNITGLSRTSFSNPFNYNENVTAFKNRASSNAGFGLALTDFVTKFRGYQSRSETLDYDPVGVSRSTDNYDYFTGPKKTIWDNTDIFPLTQVNLQPVADKTAYLLYTDNQTQVQLKTDLYGNSFALYKEIHSAKDPAVIRRNNTLDSLGNDVNTTYYCEVFDCDVFFSNPLSSGTWNLSSGYTTLQSGSGIFLSAGLNPTWQYNIPSIFFYPEIDFCKTEIKYVFDHISDSLAFTNPAAISLTDYTDFAYPSGYEATPYQSYAIITSAGYQFTGFPVSGFSFTDCGPYVNDGEDASPILVVRDYTEPTLFHSTLLPTASTTFNTNSGTLAESIGLYKQGDVYGTMRFRSANNTQIMCASAILSSVFIKYPAAIQDQAYNYVKWFDIINNTLVLETSSYLFFEPLIFDVNTLTYQTVGGEKHYLVKDISNLYSHFSNTWYDDIKDVIYVARTSLSPIASATNSRAIYFDLFRYDGEDLDTIFTPLCTTITTMSFFSLSTLSAAEISGGYIPFINLALIEKPILSYGHDTGKYSLKYFGKDPSGMFYPFEFFYQIGTDVYNLSGTVAKPAMLLYSENYSNVLSSVYMSYKILSITTTTAPFISAGSLIF